MSASSVVSGRQLPSETFRFAPSRRSSLRSCRVLATYCRSLRPFTQCLRATHSHGHGRPWVSGGHSLPPDSPPSCLLPPCSPAAFCRSLSPTRRGPESSCSKSFWDLPLVEGPRRQVHPKTTTFCLVLGFTPSRQPSKTHQSQNDFEQLQSTTLSGRSSAKECQVALLFATATCRSALPECLMLFRKPCSKTFGERCALQGLPEGGGFTKRGKIGEFGDECAFYALLRGVLSPSDFEEGYHRSASRPSTGPSRTSTW